MTNHGDIETKLPENGGRVYFVGIGGIAMSAAAGIARERGFDVAGSDNQKIYSPSKDVLELYKIPFTVGYAEENIKNSAAALFVISAGEDLSNPEVKYIYERNLPHVSLSELLYELSREQLRVVMAGTHGKSTTTGLLGFLLKSLDDSSFMAGAVLQNYDSNFYVGDGHYFVFEGDEYKAEFDDPTPKFHYYKPDILVLTNLEYDHPDLFPSMQILEDEFRDLIAKLPEDGLIIYNADDINLSRLAHESNVASVSFSINQASDFKAENVKYEKDFTTLDVFNKFSKNISSTLLGQTEEYKIQLPGEINVYNALAVIAVLRALGFSQEQIALDLLAYKGVKRRFEVVGVKNGITIVDDYAHHPTAVRETIEAARLRYGKARIWAVFEPHTYSRTKATWEDLAKSFKAADEVLISQIYPAREKQSQATITSAEVISEVKKNHSSARLVHNKKEALDIIQDEGKSGDVVIVMAVGEFNRLAYELKEVL